MNDLLEQVLAATTNGVKVLHEEHDTSKINWVRGLSDPGEMIGCGMFQELRRMDGEQDAAYAARIVPMVDAMPPFYRDKIKNSMIAAANQRAGYDTTGGKVHAFFAGKAAWTELGTVIDKAANSREAKQFAHLDGIVYDTIAMSYEHNGKTYTSDETFAIVRMDTGKQMGTVGSKYKVIQIEEGFDFLDGVLSQFGAKYESAGLLYGGKKVWMLAHLPEQRFAVNGNDACEPYVAFINSFDGTGKALCFPTVTRIECANTARTATKEKDKGIGIRHTGDIKSKIADAQRALGLSVTGITQYKDAVQQMARTPLEIKQYANRVLDQVMEVTEEQVRKGVEIPPEFLLDPVLEETERRRQERIFKNREVTLEDVLERYESERCEKAGRGTAWACYNSVTESANHGKLGGFQKGDKQTRKERRFESILSGKADEVNQVAYNVAVAAMRN